MDVSTIAIDLAKEVFQIAIANRAGRILDRLSPTTSSWKASNVKS